MSNHPYIFACLLPIKIIGDTLDDTQRSRISSLAQSIIGTSTYHCRMYVGLDDDKEHSLAAEELTSIFDAAGVGSVHVLFKRSDAGKICTYWRLLADKAHKEGCDFFALLGDDVEMHTKDWIGAIIQDFKSLHAELGLPDNLFGFGCVAVNDKKAPGFPTFPILHRIHYELNGELFGKEFVNQDADPFLFQLYRRWNAARFSKTACLTNHIGGVQLAEDKAYVVPRYERKHVDWTNDLLSQAVERISSKESCLADYACVTIDVVVPTYRVIKSFLEGILALKCSAPKVNVQFIIIVDRPDADVTWLRELEEKRPDVRVRVNPKNCGASHARNVGLNEAAAEFVLFLDDDLYPEEDILDQYVAAVRAHGGDKYDGFVGYSELPEMPNQIFPTAVHFSCVSFFWRAAQKMTHMPWGITANLFVRRTACPRFDERYIKTGGGEDIDFCLKLKRQPLLAVPGAVIVHPWWDGGQRCYRHFFNWSLSDGMLQDVYPHLTYRCAPDAVETMLLCVSSAVLLGMPLTGMVACLGVFAVDLMLDFAAIWPDPEAEPYSSGAVRVLAVLESTFIKTWSCVGRLYGHAVRGRLPANLCKRFDWFCGINKDVIAGEKRKASGRFAAFAVVIAAVVKLFA